MMHLCVSLRLHLTANCLWHDVATVGKRLPRFQRSKKNGGTGS